MGSEAYYRHVVDEQTTTRTLVSEISEPKVGEGSTGGRIHRIQLQSEGKLMTPT